MTDSKDVIRVAAGTSTKDLGAAISHAIYDNGRPILRAVGAGAVNQAVKGIAQAAQFAAGRGLSLACRPGFEDVRIGDEDKTAMVFHVFTT